MKDDRPLGIVVAAVGVCDKVVSLFVDTLHKAADVGSFELCMVTEVDDFSRSRARNKGIVSLFAKCRTIVCTDVDMLVPPGLVTYTQHGVQLGTALWAKCRNISELAARSFDWDAWVSLPIREGGTGSWVAMTVSDWLKIGGWDERLTGHGGEDDILALRRREFGIETAEVRTFPLMHVEHLPRDYRTPGGNQVNLRLGRPQPPRNFLTARTSILDHYNNHFNFFVTAKCTRDCPECSQRGFRRSNHGYVASLEAIEKWIGCTKDSGYAPYRSLILTGGEPLLWENLEEGVRLLRESGLGQQVNLFTNGDPSELVTDSLMDSLSTLRISHYGDNSESIARLKKRYGSLVDVAQRQRHYPIPKTLTGRSVLPARCGCEGPALLGGRVYGCSMLVTVADELGLDLAAYPESHCKLQVGYLELLAGFPRTLHDCCRACIGNIMLRRETVRAN